MKKIILLGYMASGKSAVGKALASKMFLPFVDLDEYIEEKEQKSIPSIFKDEGEIYFRLKEHQYLKELLEKDEAFVLSLGGGTPCYAGNMEIITKDRNAISVYLKTAIQTVVSRLEDNKSKRPLVANLSNEELFEFVAKHLFERSFFYEKTNLKIITDSKSIEDIVTELRILLH